MKTLIFSSLALVGLLLVGLQHQQMRELRSENATLQQASAEANRLKADLDKSTGDEAQDEEEIARLREENHDLLKLRNEVNQLRDTRVEFQKVSAENQRLRSQPRPTPQPMVNQTLIQPIVININALYDRGFNTPEDAVQTFYWARRDGNVDALSRCMTQPSSQYVRDYLNQPGKPAGLGNILSIEIAARHDIDANTVQLGLVIHTTDGPKWDYKEVFTLTLRNGEWKLDRKSFNQ